MSTSFKGQREIKKMIADCGLELLGDIESTEGNHLSVLCAAPNGAKQKFVMSKTPSDWRVDKKRASLFRRFAKANQPTEMQELLKLTEAPKPAVKPVEKKVSRPQLHLPKTPAAPSAPPLQRKPAPQILSAMQQALHNVIVPSAPPAPVTALTLNPQKDETMTTATHAPASSMQHALTKVGGGDVIKDLVKDKHANGTAPTTGPAKGEKPVKEKKEKVPRVLTRLDAMQTVQVADYLRSKLDWKNDRPQTWEAVAAYATANVGFKVSESTVATLCNGFGLTLYVPPKMPTDPLAILARQLLKLCEANVVEPSDEFKALLAAQGQLEL
ncbi:hypothetical protein D3C71_77700 [compost metagenome]